MRRLAFADLRAHRLRTLLSVIAVVLGVALVTGAMTLTGTMTRAASSLSASAYDGVDAAVQGRSPVSGPPTSRALRVRRCPRAPSRASRRPPASPPRPARSCATTCGSPARAARCPAPARTSASDSRSTTRRRAAFRRSTSTRGAWPSGPQAIAIDAATADREGLQPWRHRAGLPPGARRTRSGSSGLVRFGNVKALGTATTALFDLPTGAAAVRPRRTRRQRPRRSRRPGVQPAALRARLGRELGPSAQVITGPLAGPLRARRPEAVRLDHPDDPAGPRHRRRGRRRVHDRERAVDGRRPAAARRWHSCGPSARRAVRCGGWSFCRRSPSASPGRSPASSVGFGLAQGLASLFDALGLSLPTAGMQISAGTVIAALAIGTIVPLLAALRPARRAARVAPAAALRDAEDPRPGIAGRVVRVIASVVGHPRGAPRRRRGRASTAQHDATPRPHRFDGDRADDRRHAGRRGGDRRQRAEGHRAPPGRGPHQRRLRRRLPGEGLGPGVARGAARRLHGAGRPARRRRRPRPGPGGPGRGDRGRRGQRRHLDAQLRRRVRHRRAGRRAGSGPGVRHGPLCQGARHRARRPPEAALGHWQAGVRAGLGDHEPAGDRRARRRRRDPAVGGLQVRLRHEAGAVRPGRHRRRRVAGAAGGHRPGDAGVPGRVRRRRPSAGEPIRPRGSTRCSRSSS